MAKEDDKQPAAQQKPSRKTFAEQASRGADALEAWYNANPTHLETINTILAPYGINSSHNRDKLIAQLTGPVSEAIQKELIEQLTYTERTQEVIQKPSEGVNVIREFLNRVAIEAAKSNPELNNASLNNYTHKITIDPKFTTEFISSADSIRPTALLQFQPIQACANLLQHCYRENVNDKNDEYSIKQIKASFKRLQIDPSKPIISTLMKEIEKEWPHSAHNPAQSFIQEINEAVKLYSIKSTPMQMYQSLLQYPRVIPPIDPLTQEEHEEVDYRKSTVPSKEIAKLRKTLQTLATEVSNSSTPDARLGEILRMAMTQKHSPLREVRGNDAPPIDVTKIRDMTRQEILEALQEHTTLHDVPHSNGHPSNLPLNKDGHPLPKVSPDLHNLIHGFSTKGFSH